MHPHEKREVRNLTHARRWLWANGHFRHELPIAERARRVAEYARQVERYGKIVAYLPPPPPSPPSRTEPGTPVYRSRFDQHGDALRPRR